VEIGDQWESSCLASLLMRIKNRVFFVINNTGKIPVEGTFDRKSQWKVLMAG
jgi:hypothetical protein